MRGKTISSNNWENRIYSKRELELEQSRAKLFNEHKDDYDYLMQLSYQGISEEDNTEEYFRSKYDQ